MTQIQDNADDASMPRVIISRMDNADADDAPGHGHGDGGWGGRGSGVGGGDLSYTSYYFRYADKPYQKDVTCSNSQLFFHLKTAVKSN